MPRKRLTFIVIPANDGHVREYRLSPSLLYAFALAAICFVGAFGYYAKGFYQKVNQEEALAQLHDENGDLLRSVELTRKEVDKIEGLMGRLAADDERLRDYHTMEPFSADIRLGGVGGSEDLPEEDMASLPEPKRQMVRELSARIQQLKQMARFQEKSFAQIERRYLESEGDLRHFPTITPVQKSWISSHFGDRTDPFTGRKARHLGVDFAGRTGMPIYATGDGKVIHAYLDRRLGNVVVIEHSVREINEDGEKYTRKGTFRTEYGHMEKLMVKAGDYIKRNQQIGTMGSTGRSTGPHLHYAVRYIDRRRGGDKGYVDPEKFFLDNVQRGAAAKLAQVSGWVEK